MSPTLDVRPKDLATIQHILQQYVKPYPVWAFGSRVKGTAKPYSDLDLAIITDEPLPFSVQGQLADAFSESDLPFRVDFLDWSSISEDFKKHIQAHYKQIQP